MWFEQWWFRANIGWEGLRETGSTWHFLGVFLQISEEQSCIHFQVSAPSWSHCWTHPKISALNYIFYKRLHFWGNAKWKNNNNNMLVFFSLKRHKDAEDPEAIGCHWRLNKCWDLQTERFKQQGLHEGRKWQGSSLHSFYSVKTIN